MRIICSVCGKLGGTLQYTEPELGTVYLTIPGAKLVDGLVSSVSQCGWKLNYERCNKISARED